MNILTQNNIKTMSSLEIAALTNKNHAHILRDIRKMIEQIGNPKMDYEQYQAVTDKHTQRTSEVKLDKTLTLTLITGYDAGLRYSITKRWDELEKQQSAALPDFTNPYESALAWAEQYKAKEVAQAQLELAAPKVSAYDKLIDSTHLKSVGDVAKSIGLRSAQALNIKLETVNAYDNRCGNRVWSGWFIEQGLGEMKTSSDGWSSNKMTAKGQAWAFNLFGGNK